MVRLKFSNFNRSCSSQNSTKNTYTIPLSSDNRTSVTCHVSNYRQTDARRDNAAHLKTTVRMCLKNYVVYNIVMNRTNLLYQSFFLTPIFRFYHFAKHRTYYWLRHVSSFELVKFEWIHWRNYWISLGPIEPKQLNSYTNTLLAFSSSTWCVNLTIHFP